MLGNKTLMICAVLVGTAFSFGGNLESDWNDFLHFTAIGRFEIARSYGESIIDSDPDPVRLLELSKENARGYSILMRVYNDNDELRDVASKILDLIEKGRFIRRTDPEIIRGQIERLSTTIRGRISAEQNLKNSGEYAIPFMIDVLADENRKDEHPYVSAAMGKMGRDVIRALAAALQTDNAAVKAEIIRAMGQIRYPESLAYLKFVYENTKSNDIKNLAEKSIEMIDPSALKIPASRLFLQLAESYYYHSDSIAPSAEFDFANMWFWDEGRRMLTREEVSKDYFFEIMAMRSCESALKANPDNASAIALWLNSYFKAEQQQIPMPDYFGEGYADAMTYATTAGPEYLHEALARGINDKDGYIALNIVEALAVNAGEASLLYRFGTEQPLVEALSFGDTAVELSAAIALGGAGPTDSFTGSGLIIENLATAITREKADELGSELAMDYAFRAMEVMTKLAVSRNEIVDLQRASDALIRVLNGDNDDLRLQAAYVLSYLDNPRAQRAIADVCLDDNFSNQIRIEAFDSLINSAKLNGQLITESQIDEIYELVSSTTVDPSLRAAAAGAYGALNLPSRRVKDLILDQAKS